MAGNALEIARGGTSQTTVPGARKALGLEIGVDVQEWNANLQDLADLANINDLLAVEALNTHGFVVRTAADTWTTRSLVAPAAGLQITNPAGIAGDATFALANDLAALEALSGTNTMYYRSATSTWTAVTVGPTLAFSGGTLNTSRTIIGTAPIIVTDGDGVSGNPTISISATVPIGSIMDYAGTSVPTGWLFCYGQAISRSTYSVLFAAISTVFGIGDGSTTFNVPDLRGRVTAGQDDMGGTSANRLTGLSGGIDGDTMGVAGGLESHTLTIAQLPAHDHGTNTGNQSAQHDHGVSGTTGGTSGNHSHAENANSTVGPNIGVQWWSNSTTNTNTVNITAVGSPGHTHNFSTTSDASTTNHTHVISSQGSGTAHNIVQPTMILNKIIYTGV